MGLKDRLRFRISSATQKWLNTRIPPRKGRRFDRNRVEHTAPDAAVLVNRHGRITAGPFNNGVFRVGLESAYGEAAWSRHRPWAVDPARQNPDGWGFGTEDDALLFTHRLTDGRQARIRLKVAEGTLSAWIGPELLLAEVPPPQTTARWLLVNQRLPRAGAVRVFGLGENTPPMDKAGQTVVMWNTDKSDYEAGDNPLYKSLPVAVFQYADGPACGLVFESPAYARFDFSADGKNLRYAVRDTELSYFILLGPTLPEVMAQLASLTGTPAPLPKWALGYQQSRWSYAPSGRVREIAAGFRNRDIPCDVIHLDIGYMDRYQCFTWGRGFEDHRDLLRELHGQGFKAVTILDPGIKVEPGYHAYDSGVRRRAFVTGKKGENLSRPVWPGPCHFPDFLNPAVREWWGDLVKDFAESSGVDGIWCDMNEPSTFDLRRTLPPGARHRVTESAALPHERVHNAYGLLMSKAVHDGLLGLTPLPYVITRATYLGGQKYAATWTGDNAATWEHLRASIPMILNLGLSGQPVTGPDIGGFRGTPSPALYARWIVQGALYPYCRTHTCKDTGDQEPWSFGPDVEAAARRAIKLRYRLVPYLYSLLFEAARTGQPVMRPIFYDAPSAGTLRPEYYETEFLLGPYLLAAPLMDPAPTRTCHLPPGKWYSWWSRRERSGGRDYETVIAEDTDLPLFIRENAVVPLYPEPPSFIPDRSLGGLEVIITVEDRAEGLVVEYFDREALLAFPVRAVTKKGGIEVEVGLIRKGAVPPAYHPPETLHLLLNHRIHRLEVTSPHAGHSLAPDPANGAWTRITVAGPAFPFRGRLVCD